MAEVKNMLHKVQHLFLSTSVSAQSCRRRGEMMKERGGWERRCEEGKDRSQEESGKGSEEEKIAGRGESEKRIERQEEMRNEEKHTLH